MAGASSAVSCADLLKLAVTGLRGANRVDIMLRHVRIPLRAKSATRISHVHVKSPHAPIPISSFSRQLHQTRLLRSEEGKEPPKTPGGDTIFGKIIRKEIKADVVYEDDLCLAFRDVSPQAPTHILMIPKNPVDRLANLTPQHKDIMGHLMVKASEVAKKENLDGGYRLVINDGKDGCQSVYHLHIHIIGGRKLSWPPG
ncbi:hypothetical protein PROFUN_02283 [Planoprotostelium fungivorum]|uniref:HIT domain-containing protein n=1 Tax=Planoprotostelium fungivorum TaxID=1890364 RepID=A0A2P6NYG9_9EUKA|nr:hypothetical protein PROFUN_02283 [Planoprotostelium fungivorum]